MVKLSANDLDKVNGGAKYSGAEYDAVGIYVDPHFFGDKLFYKDDKGVAHEIDTTYGNNLVYAKKKLDEYQAAYNEALANVKGSYKS